MRVRPSHGNFYFTYNINVAVFAVILKTSEVYIICVVTTEADQGARISEAI